MNSLRGEQLMDKLYEAFKRGLTIEGCGEEVGIKVATVYSTMRQWGLRVVTRKSLENPEGQRVETSGLPDLAPEEYRKLEPKSPRFYGYLAKELEAGGTIPSFAGKAGDLKAQTLYTNLKRAGYKIV